MPEHQQNRPVIAICPSCSGELCITRLSCSHCGLEISNHFSLSPFARLSQEQTAWIEKFIQYNGNRKEMQRHFHTSYAAVNQQLEKLKKSLNLTPPAPVKENQLEPVIRELPVYKDDGILIRVIKQKLNAAGGIANIPLPRGKSFPIIYEEYGNGIQAGNLPKNRILTWIAFAAAFQRLSDAAYAASRDFAKPGYVSKGNAMKGKLGSKELPIDSLEGYVALHAYGVQIGESCQRLIPSLAAILEWSGLCKNGYGYVELLIDVGTAF